MMHCSGRVLASSAGGPRFNPQSSTVSYQRRYKNGTSIDNFACLALKVKRETLAISQK